MFSLSNKSSTDKTRRRLKRMESGKFFNTFESAGQRGVEALSRATPVDTRGTALSWTYEIVHEKGSHRIIWKNTNMAGQVSVAVLLQLGHGTGTGGYVRGRDYINPAMKPIFDQIKADVRKAVTSNG